jgi:branched-chain amino acid transport system permease protein
MTAFGAGPRAVAAVVVLLLLPFGLGEYLTYQAAQILVYAVAVLGLVLLIGHTGQISVGHGALFALGAYTTAILTARFDVPYLLTIIIAAVASFAVGILLGIPALRIRGIYLALVTLAVALLLTPILKRFKDVTGGVFGMSVPVVEPPLPIAPVHWIYLLAVIASVVGVLALRNLLGSRIGLALTAVRDNETMAAAMGVDVRTCKILAFAIASAFGGVGGSIYALLAQYVAPDTFTVTLSTSFVVAAMVGGVRSITGAFLGAVFIVLVPDITNSFSHSLTQLVMAVAILVVIYLQPTGIVGIARAVGARFQRGRDFHANTPMVSTDVAPVVSGGIGAGSGSTARDGL